MESLKDTIDQLNSLIESIKNGERDVALAPNEYEAIESAVEYLHNLNDLYR